MKFKKILSAALATVMAASVMSVGMVSVASAADYTNGTVVVDSTQKIKTWTFTTNMPTGKNTTLSDNDTVNGIVINKAASTNLNKSNYLSAGVGTIFSVPVPANSAGNIYIQATSGSTERSVSFTDGAETKTIIMNTGDPSPGKNQADFTTAATSTGYIQLTAAGGECKIGKIVVTLTDGTFTDAPTTTYTVSGTSNLTKDDTFTIGSYTATVQDGGAWSIETTDVLAAGTTLTIIKGGYTVSPESVTLAGESPFDVGAITFTALPWNEIEEGDYDAAAVAAGHPNFDISELEHEAGHTDRIVGNLKMKLKATATVTVTGKCSSSNTSKWITLEIAGGEPQKYTGGQAVEFVASNVPAGEQTLTIKTDTSTSDSNTTLTVTNINIKYEGAVEPGTDPQPEETTGPPVLAGSGLENILGAEFATPEGEPEGTGRLAEFEEKIFTDADGASTGLIKGQKYIQTHPRDKEPLKISSPGNGILSIYLASNTNSNKEFYIQDANNPDNLIGPYTAYGDDYTGGKLQPIDVPVKAGESYIFTQNVHVYAAKFIAGDILTPTPVDGDPDDYFIEDGNTTYIIHAVTDTEKNDYQSLVLEGDTANKTRTDTVYQSVEINGQTIDASAVKSTFLYAIKVTDSAKVGAPTKKVEWINGGAIQ